MATKQTAKTLHRSEVPTEQTWDLTDLFATDVAWENELTKIKTDVQQVVQYKGKLGLMQLHCSPVCQHWRSFRSG
jgi:oligoendopeptidase F